MVKKSDKVIAITDEGEVLPEYIPDSSKLIRWSNVQDPKGKDLIMTRKIKDQIKTLVEDFVQTLN